MHKEDEIKNKLFTTRTEMVNSKTATDIYSTDKTRYTKLQV